MQSSKLRDGDGFIDSVPFETLEVAEFEFGIELPLRSEVCTEVLGSTLIDLGTCFGESCKEEAAAIGLVCLSFSNQ